MGILNLRNLALFASVFPCTASYLVAPPTAAAADTVSDCTMWTIIIAGDTCTSVAADYGITADQFSAYNPSVVPACQMTTGNSYCVEQNWGLPVATSSSTAATTATVTSKASTTINTLPSTTKLANGISTPMPIQSGLVSNCDDFYLGKSGDICYNIAQTYGITLEQLYAWNPAVGNGCGALWPTYYICVSIISVQPSKSTLVTSAKATSSYVLPQPCWFDVSKGQYICDGSSPPTKTSAKPTTTKAGNGIATPTPVQTGMTGNCKKFYKVVSGDGCWAIANNNNIALNDFYKWNTAVGSDCKTLYPDYYVCVGI